MCLHLSAAGFLWRRIFISRFLYQGEVRRWKLHEPIRLQLVVGHQASALFRLQARAEGNLGILLAECDHITEDGSTFITPDWSDEEQTRCQPVSFGHEAANAVESSAVVAHQVGVIGVGEKLAGLELLALKKFFRNQLSLLCHQRPPTVFCS